MGLSGANTRHTHHDQYIFQEKLQPPGITTCMVVIILDCPILERLNQQFEMLNHD